MSRKLASKAGDEVETRFGVGLRVEVSNSSTTTTNVSLKSASTNPTAVTIRPSTPSPTPTKHHKPAKTRSTPNRSTSPKSETVAPSPTSYGSAPRKGCVNPPQTFEGSEKGFSNLCRIRYCDAKPRRNMIWSGLDGDVTREEIESALGMLAQLEPVWENFQGNILGDGALGQGAYSASLLFEITGDIRALDVAVRISDNILALQNQNTKQPMKIWTGEIDSVWPTTHKRSRDGGPELIYAGCEQGEIVANMVNSALMILKSPCLWRKVPPVFDGPTVFNETATYYDRALAYIAAGDDTYDNYFFRFFDSAGSIIQPADERWWATGDSRAPGTLMPWNRRMQIVHGALNSQPDERKSEGMDIFNWDYSAGEEHTEESKGIHALYDIFGSFLAWQRSSATNYISNSFGQIMANTFQTQIYLGNGSFSGLVTGESTTKGHMIDSLWGHWSFYGFFLPEWYSTVATSNVEHGFQGRTWLAIPLLWTKHALFVDDLTFWTGRYSSGYGYVLGTNGKASSSVVQWGQASIPSSSLAAVSLGLCGIMYLLLS
ncbi:uncharacterized protein JCM6883_006417 [Sporobolomyces salmoneus]|uniref:uncharacterized protein n=1 Tax=Sporobolomyces salmoneus TaxID=183962 RepID=UPI0031701E70